MSSYQRRPSFVPKRDNNVRVTWTSRQWLRILRSHRSNVANLISAGFILFTLMVSMASEAVAEEEKPPQTSQETSAPTIKGKLTGSISIESTQQPAVNADIYLVKKPDEHFTLPLKPQKSQSNDNGVFEFENLEPGSYLVYSFTGDLASRTKKFRFERTQIDSHGAQQGNVQLSLKPSARLRVRVKSKSTGNAIAGAFVEFKWTDLPSDHFIADDDGEILIPNLTAEKWHIEAAAEGHVRAFKDVQLSFPETVVDFLLEPGGEVNGTVVDGSGAPLPNVSLSVCNEKTSMYSYDKVKTDTLGRFRLAYVPQDQSLRIQTSADGFQYQMINHRLGDPDVKITLQPIPDAGNVSGQILDRDGHPIRGAKIRNQGMSSAWEREAVTKEDGGFLIKHLFFSPGGSVKLIIRAEGFCPQEVTVPGENLDGTTPLIVKLERGLTALGRVVDQLGQPVGGCWIYYNGGGYGTGGIGGRVIANSLGEFEITSLPAGSSFEFVARGFSRLNTNQMIMGPDEFNTVTLTAMGVIVGNVSDAESGKPIKDFTIRIDFPSKVVRNEKKSSGIESTRRDPGESFINENGHFQLDRFDEGTTYDLLISAVGYETKRMDSITTVPLDKAEQLKIELQRTK